MGFDYLDVYHNPVLKRILERLRRMRGEPDNRERRPITRNVLLRLISQFDQSLLYGATLHASLCLAFADFLGIGAFSWSPINHGDNFTKYFITKRFVPLFEDQLELMLPSSQNDPFCKRITLPIATAVDTASPVRSLCRLLTGFPSNSSDPFFNAGRPFTRYLVTEILGDNLKKLGYAGHSSGYLFRRGATMSAREAGVSKDKTMRLSRWKSDSYRLYIVTNPTYVLNATRRLQRSFFYCRLLLDAL